MKGRADGGLGLFEAAQAAHAAGLCVLPPRQDGSKRPIGDAWDQYQQERPTEATLAGWYGDPIFAAYTGLGLVCGAVSGNLELFEFDDPDTHSAFKAAAVATGLGPLVERIEAAYLERSPGGVHWFTRCAVISANTKLACRPKRPEEMQHPKDKTKVLIETRGEGGYAIVAPTSGAVHPSGQPYVRLAGKFATIPTLTPDEREALWELARSFDQLPKQRAAEPRTTVGLGERERPGDAFSRQAKWLDLLEPHGWAYVYERGEVTYWRRPGKLVGISASTNYAGSNLLYVFSTSTDFDAARGYSPFSAYAILAHAGDFTAAARALAALGYGDGSAAVLAPAACDTRATGIVNGRAPGIAALKTLSAAELLGLELPEPRWAVPGLVPEGLGLFVGKGKIGKSWLALGLGLAVAAGGVALGSRAVERGRVLYLALEDNQRRLQRRLRERLGVGPPPELLEFQTEWPRLDAGGLELLAAWLEAHSDARLVIVDTLAKVRGRGGRVARLYDDDYLALEGLKALADRYGVAIILIHHSRKADADDVLDVVSGTTGLTGAADTILVLKRSRGQADATLFATGRDLDDTELALKWDALTVSWTIMGDAEEYRVSTERAAILAVLRAEPGFPKDVAETLGKKPGAVRKLMWTMAQAGNIKADAEGRYHVCSDGNSGNAGNAPPRHRAGTAPGDVTSVTAPNNHGNASAPEIAHPGTSQPQAVTAVTAVTVTDVTSDDRTSCEACGEPLAPGEQDWCAPCRADTAAQLAAVGR